MVFNQNHAAPVGIARQADLTSFRVQETPVGRPPMFTVVIPFYNEADYVEKTLRSLFAQSEDSFRLLLVDNGSTDDSAEICRALIRNKASVDAEIFKAPKPEKIEALAAACSRLETPYVAFCDADTIYPSHYLKRAREIFEKNGSAVVGVLAMGVACAPRSWKSVLARCKSMVVATLLSRQCHTGGFGKIFRTDTFLRSGGYSSEIWPYVLEDHEVIQRVLKAGACRYDMQMWCTPSNRRSDRRSTSWTTVEKLVYHLTPFALKDWYFHSFLPPRLRRRGQLNTALRDKPWEVKKLDVTSELVLDGGDHKVLVDERAQKGQEMRTGGGAAQFMNKIGLAVILGGILLATRNSWAPAGDRRPAHLHKGKARHWRSVGH